MRLHVADYIKNLAPYVPGKPNEETLQQLKIKKLIKLASNENPLGPSPKAIEAIKGKLESSHLYPDGAGYYLKRSLSAFLNGSEGAHVSERSLILGNGSNEVIDLVVRAFCMPGDCIVTQQAAFIAYKIAAQVQGVATVEVPIRHTDLKFDCEALVDVVKKNDRVRVLFIPNPNNPTGAYLTTSELDYLMSETDRIRGGSVLVVLDYAYWDYVTAMDLPDPVPWLRKWPQMMILRTFSKIYGLAGIRLGYGIASPEIVEFLEKVRQPFNVNSMALVAGEAALTDHRFLAKSKKINDEGKFFWKTELDRIGVKNWPSQGNFILVDTNSQSGLSGPELFERCLKEGVVFRPLVNYGLPNFLRISIGTPEENKFAFDVYQRSAGLGE